jgi:Protein of unknown function (DUF3631)
MSRREPDFALNVTRNFIEAIMWAPEEQLDALTLVLALTHVKDLSPNVPYVLATGKREAGKSTLTKNIPLLLASRTFVVDRMTTTEAVRNVFLNAEPPDTLLFDDASKIWGESGRSSTTNVQTQLAVAAYEDTGKVQVSRNGSTVEAPAYCVSFFNGLGNVLPEDVRTRCIVFPTTAKPEGVRKRGARTTPVRKDAEPVKLQLSRWANTVKRDASAWLIENGHRIHPLLDSRLLQLWGPLFALAHQAGGQWPRRCMDAFLALGLDASEKPVVQRDEQALLDTAKIIMSAGVDRVFTAELIPALRALPDPYYREVDTKYLVEDLLPRALGPSREMRGKNMDGESVRGMGRMAAPVLAKAAELHEELYPEPEQAGPDRVQRELTLTRG